MLKARNQVQLIGPDERHLRFIKRTEADCRVEKGEAHWLSCNIVQLEARSRRTQACLTATDSERLAGIRHCSLEQLSRVDAWSQSRIAELRTN